MSRKEEEGEEERCVREIVGVRARRGAAPFAKGSRIVKAYYHINSEGKQLITRRAIVSLSIKREAPRVQRREDFFHRPAP